ncbi:protein PYRICULARIA ORYZAE RESISTANCE 21-like [Magnolia sinica]|uniref:protein PYRICULARIA ORYZAE RESISTANCE 21-like n=1 Tax=Magnolia sinica TaxID=86752 RepID=UPI0026588EA8|nr:protein PYRICULARIA ORYZAE RESISTANCE 21-like [Magnolia sinica]
MADKVSTLVLKVDLDCDPCYKKIRKALCQFREIQSQSFDEKQKKVTISGPFDPEKLIKKLYCKVGCKIIICYEVVPPPPPPPPPEPKPLVTGMVLRGIFLLRKKELDWFYEGGAAAIFPYGNY